MSTQPEREDVTEEWERLKEDPPVKPTVADSRLNRELEKFINHLGDQVVKVLQEFGKQAGLLLASIPPDVRRKILSGEYQPKPYNPCHCLCALHKAKAPGVCTGEAETYIHTNTPTIGPHNVPLCNSCAMAWLEKAGAVK